MQPLPSQADQNVVGDVENQLVPAPSTYMTIRSGDLPTMDTALVYVIQDPSLHNKTEVSLIEYSENSAGMLQQTGRDRCFILHVTM